MPAGAPSKLKPEHIEIARALAEIGMPLSKIAARIGFCERSLSRWLNEPRPDDDDSLKGQFCRAIRESWVETGRRYLRNLQDQAANGSAAAATWYLTHHPYFRDDFSDAAADRRTEKRTIATVIEAITAAGLPQEDEQRLLLHMQARGLAAQQQEQDPDDQDADDQEGVEPDVMQ